MQLAGMGRNRYQLEMKASTDALESIYVTPPDHQTLLVLFYALVDFSQIDQIERHDPSTNKLQLIVNTCGLGQGMGKCIGAAAAYRGAQRLAARY